MKHFLFQPEPGLVANSCLHFWLCLLWQRYFMTVSAATDTTNVVIMAHLASGDELTICKLQRQAERKPSIIDCVFINVYYNKFQPWQ